MAASYVDGAMPDGSTDGVKSRSGLGFITGLMRVCWYGAFHGGLTPFWGVHCEDADDPCGDAPCPEGGGDPAGAGDAGAGAAVGVAAGVGAGAGCAEGDGGGIAPAGAAPGAVCAWAEPAIPRVIASARRTAVFTQERCRM